LPLKGNLIFRGARLYGRIRRPTPLGSFSASLGRMIGALIPFAVSAETALAFRAFIIRVHARPLRRHGGRAVALRGFGEWWPQYMRAASLG
jgi:hypothetical protein